MKLDKDIKKGMKFGFGIFLTLGLLLGLVWAGTHLASQVIPGTFIGNFIFNGNTTFNGSSYIRQQENTQYSGLTILSQDGTSRAIRIWASNDGSSKIESGVDGVGNLLLNTGGGNVGIGTNQSNSPLEIKGQNIVPLQSLIITTNTFTYGSNGSYLRFGHGTSSGNTYSEIDSLINGGSNYGNLSLQVGGGNVGIGTTNPQAKLEVNGSIKANNVGAAAFTYVTNTVTSAATGTSTSWSSKVFATCTAGYSLATWALTGSNAQISGTYHYCLTGKENATSAYVQILDDNNNANLACTVTAFCIKD